MTIARSVARSVASPVARAVSGGGGVSYDPVLLAYFAAVEGAGGSFDLSSISGTYTESYVKAAHSTLFASLKSYNVLDKITELYLLIGKTFPGITIKAKGTGSLTNNNFVEGDYVAAGSGAGLKGNAATKSLSGTTLLSSPDATLGFYCTETTALTGDVCIGCNDAGFTNRSYMDHANCYLLSNVAMAVDTRQVGAWNFSRTSGSLLRAYLNGLQEAENTTTITPVAPSVKPFLFALNNNGGSTGVADSRLSAAWIGRGLDATEAANLTDAIETFMDALGAGVIA